MDLGARHQQLAIRAGADRVRQRRPETRPAGAAVELGCRRIEVLPAALAREQPRAMLVVQRARERPLGGRVAQNRISQAATLLPPLGIALGYGKHRGGLRRPAASATTRAPEAKHSTSLGTAQTENAHYCSD